MKCTLRLKEFLPDGSTKTTVYGEDMNEFKVITVRKDDLESYIKEYHHRKANDTCKADGQDWPCDVYRRLTEALNG